MIFCNFILTFLRNINYAVLTFDDGLVDHFYVHQQLKKLNISGTFLIPTAPVVEQKMMAMTSANMSQ